MHIKNYNSLKLEIKNLMSISSGLNMRLVVLLKEIEQIDRGGDLYGRGALLFFGNHWQEINDSVVGINTSFSLIKKNLKKNELI